MKKINNYILEKLKIARRTQVDHPLEFDDEFIIVLVEGDEHIFTCYGTATKDTSLEDLEYAYGENFNQTNEPRIPRKMVKAFYGDKEGRKKAEEYKKFLKDKYGYK